MGNFKIRTNQETYNQVGSLLLENGFYIKASTGKDWVIGELGGVISSYSDWRDGPPEWFYTIKEITLPELRDMVVLNRNDLDDANVEEENCLYDLYLTKAGDLYFYHCGKNKWILSNISGDESYYKSLKPIEKTTLSDQYAEIEQVRQDEMKEYLIPSANYKYQKAYPITSWREWIEIPNGAEWAKLWDKGESYESVEFYRGKNEFFSNLSKKWMRGADESTNKIGQPATIIWNRHALNSAVTLHGTVKVEPDLNFGVAQSTKDNINHPSYYTQGKVECIEALESATIGKSGIEAVCVANVIKYLWRYEDKNGLEDVKKAQWYLERLVASMGS